MNRSDLSRDQYMLEGALAQKGYDWWWHSFTAQEQETGEEKAFFIEYFMINPSVSPDKVRLGQKEGKAPRKPSYFMVKCGTWGKDARQLHQFYPCGLVQIAKDKLELQTKDCYLSEHCMKGKVSVSKEKAAKPEYMCDAGEMEWDLKIYKKIAYHVGYGASRFFRKLQAFEMFWHAEGMKTEYEGSLRYMGKTYIVTPRNCYGYADKNWGKDFTSPWVWISSCNMKSLLNHKSLPNSVLEVGGGRPKVAGIALNRKLLIDLYYEGHEYEFNFSKFWMQVRTKFHCYETKDQIVWKIETQNRNSILQIKCYCKKEDMLLINYEAPDGVKRHNRLWNGGNGHGEIRLYKKSGKWRELVDHIAFTHAGCEWGEYDK